MICGVRLQIAEYKAGGEGTKARADYRLQISVAWGSASGVERQKEIADCR